VYAHLWPSDEDRIRVAGSALLRQAARPERARG